MNPSCTGFSWTKAGPGRFIPCVSTANMHYERKWYCGTHFPPNVKATWESQKQTLARNLALVIWKTSDRLHLTEAEVLDELLHVVRQKMTLPRYKNSQKNFK